MRFETLLKILGSILRPKWTQPPDADEKPPVETVDPITINPAFFGPDDSGGSVIDLRAQGDIPTGSAVEILVTDSKIIEVEPDPREEIRARASQILSRLESLMIEYSILEYLNNPAMVVPPDYEARKKAVAQNPEYLIRQQIDKAGRDAGEYSNAVAELNRIMADWPKDNPENMSKAMRLWLEGMTPQMLATRFPPGKFIYAQEDYEEFGIKETAFLQQCMRLEEALRKDGVQEAMLIPMIDVILDSLERGLPQECTAEGYKKYLSYVVDEKLAAWAETRTEVDVQLQRQKDKVREDAYRAVTEGSNYKFKQLWLAELFGGLKFEVHATDAMLIAPLSHVPSSIEANRAVAAIGQLLKLEGSVSDMPSKGELFISYAPSDKGKPLSLEEAAEVSRQLEIETRSELRLNPMQALALAKIYGENMRLIQRLSAIHETQGFLSESVEALQKFGEGQSKVPGIFH